MSLLDQHGQEISISRETVSPSFSERDVEFFLEALQESYDFMYKRAQEDATWQKLAGDAQASAGLPYETKVEWSRNAYLTEPLVKRGLQLATEFAFGSGVDGPRGKYTGVSDPGEEGGTGDVKLLEDFWFDPLNQQAMFSAPMQVRRSNQLLIDGSLFLKLFTVSKGTNKTIQVRRYPTLIVKHIIPHPEDSSRPMYYACSVSDKKYDMKTAQWINTENTHWEYIPDYNNIDPDDDPMYAEAQENILKWGNEGVYMMHVSINGFEDCGFGEPEAITSLKWLAGNKMISEDQATISRATAALMTILQTKTTNETALGGLKNSLQSISDSGGPSKKLPGGVNVVAGEMELKQNRVSTQAQDAWTNSRLMRVPAAAGMGTGLHYLADPENANLATTTSMELPILRHLEAYQTLWRWVYGDMCNFVLRQAGREVRNVKYDISMPPILERDLAKVSAALIDGEASGFITADQAAQRYMETLNLDDIPTRMEELREYRHEMEKKQVDEAAARMEMMDRSAPGAKVRDVRPEPNPDKKYPTSQAKV